MGEIRITWEPKITYEGQGTFTLWCERCEADYPHIRGEGFVECAVCGTRTERSAAGGE